MLPAEPECAAWRQASHLWHPPGVAGTRMQGHERFSFIRHDTLHFCQVILNNSDVRFQRDYRGSHERDNFQVTHDFGLEINVRHPPVKRGSIGCFEANRHLRTQAQQERVGVSPATMYLNGEVKTFMMHTGKKMLLFGRVFSDMRVIGVVHTYTPVGRNDDDAINWSRSVFEKGGVPGFSQQYNFSLRIGGTQGFQRGKCKDEIAKAIGAKYGNFAHTGYDLIFR